MHLCPLRLIEDGQVLEYAGDSQRVLVTDLGDCGEKCTGKPVPPGRFSNEGFE